MIKNECNHAYKHLDKAECLWCENCVEKLVNRIQKPKVSKAFIGKVTARIYCDRKSSEAIKTHIREAFETAGIEIGGIS